MAKKKSIAKKVLDKIKRAKGKGPVLTLKKLKESTQNMREKINEPRPVAIKKVTPLAGNKTLTVSAEARGSSLYPMTITFYNVDYSTEKDSDHPLTAVVDDMNTTLYMEQVT